MPVVKRSKVVADEEGGPSLVKPPPVVSEQRDAAPLSPPSVRVASPPEDATVESAPQTPSVASTHTTMESVPSHSHVRSTESTNDALEQCMEVLSPDLSTLSDVHIDNPFGANDDPNSITWTDDIELCLDEVGRFIDEDDRNKLESEPIIPRWIGANDHYIDELANMDKPPSRRSASTPSTTPARMMRAQRSSSTKRKSSTHRPSPLKRVDPNRIDSQHPPSGGGFSDTEWKLLHMTSQVSSERLVLSKGDVRIALLERGETCASLQGAARRCMRLAHANHGVNSIPHIVSDTVDNKEQVHIVEFELDRVRDIIPTIVHFDSGRCSWLHDECMSLEEHRERDTMSTMEKIERLCDDPTRVFVDNKNRRSDMCCSKILDDFRMRAKEVKRIHVARMDMVVSTDDGNTASVTGTPFVITSKRLYDRLCRF